MRYSSRSKGRKSCVGYMKPVLILKVKSKSSQAVLVFFPRHWTASGEDLVSLIKPSPAMWTQWTLPSMLISSIPRCRVSAGSCRETSPTGWWWEDKVLPSWTLTVKLVDVGLESEFIPAKIPSRAEPSNSTLTCNQPLARFVYAWTKHTKQQPALPSLLPPKKTPMLSVTGSWVFKLWDHQ